MCQQTRLYSFNKNTKYFTRGWLCFVGRLFGNKVSSSVIRSRQVRQSWIKRPELEKLPLAVALNAGLARVNFANFVILVNASSNLHNQARRSITYTLQVEKIHCRMNHLNHQSFPYSQSHPKFVLRFYSHQNIETDIRGHFRWYSYQRGSPPVTTEWLVLRLRLKKTAPNVEGKKSRGADEEFWVE
jgi:hypothetical protein